MDYKMLHSWESRSPYQGIAGTFRLIYGREPYCKGGLYKIQKMRLDELNSPVWDTITTWKEDDHNQTALTALANAVKGFAA